MIQAQHHGDGYKEKKSEQAINDIHSARQVAAQGQPGKKTVKAVNEFRDGIIAPIHPRRVKHLEKHGIVGIGRHRNFNDASGPRVEPRDREMVREFITRSRGDQTKKNFRREQDDNHGSQRSTQRICLAQRCAP